MQHIGLSLGRIERWHDGISEFGRQLASALATHAESLRDEGLRLHLHLPRPWHGLLGDAVGYLDTRDVQRWWHRSRTPFALWHVFHQYNRFLPPAGTRHVVETVHDLNFLRLKTPAKARAYRAQLQRRLGRRSAVVTISRFVADELARELPALAAPVHVIHNGATDLTGAPREPVVGIEAGNYLLHVSRLAPSKNIQAIVDLAAAWPEQPFVLAGNPSPEMRQRLLAQATARPNLRLAFDITDAQKAWLYAECRAFVFPSLTEGFGLPPLEAMHFGKPVFLSRLTSLPEVGGDVATYFDDFAPSTMRATIDNALRTRTRDAAFTARVQAHASQFTWARCAQLHLALYRALIAGAR